MNDQSPPSVSLHHAANLMEFFRDELVRACEQLGIRPSPHTEAYVVGLLDGFSRLDPTKRDALGFTRPAAFMYGDAVHSGGDQRLEHYQRLGDTCLVHCGFFAPTLERRGMSERYYQQMGRGAYARLGELFGYKQPGGALALVFDELSRQFSLLSAAIKRVAGRRERETELEALLAKLTYEEKQKRSEETPLRSLFYPD